MIGTLWVVNKFIGGKKVENSAINTALKVALLVGIIGLTVALASFVGSQTNWKSIGMFFLGFIGLIAMTCGTLWILSKTGVIKASLKSVYQFGLLLAMSAAVMLMGSLFMDIINVENLIKFALVLAGFVMGISLAYRIAAGGRGSAMKHAQRFAKLIILSAGILLFGGLFFTWFPEIIPGVVKFALVLGGFIIAMGFAYKLAGKSRASTWAGMLMLTIMLGVSAWILFTAAHIMEDNPATFKNVILFEVALLGLVGGMILLARWAGKSIMDIILGTIAIACIELLIYGGILLVEKLTEITLLIEEGGGFGKLWGTIGTMMAVIVGMGVIAAIASFLIEFIIPGIIALAFVELAIWGAAKVLQDIAEVSLMIKLAGGQGEIWKTIGTMIGMILLVGGIATAIGALVTGTYGIGAVVIAAGLAVIAGIAGTILLLAHSLKQIALAMKEMDNIKNIDSKKILNNLKVVVQIANALRPISKNAFSLILASKAIKQIAIVISEVSNVVHDYAELKIPIYEGKKLVGYRQMKDEDFQSAARNVKKIISVLGRAVIETYESNPEIFETDFWGRSKFSKVTKSLSTLAPMISKIAESVKDYASMKIGVDFKMKNGFLVPTNYRYLGDEDYKAAARNVSTIISVLGKAVIDAYELHPEYFETSGGFLGLGGSSKFAKVTKALSKLGPMISSIAEGVKDYADMKIGINYKPNEMGIAMPTNYRNLTDKDFENARTNITTIINTMVEALYDVSQGEYKDFFEDGWFSDSPISKVVKTVSKLGPMITSIAEGVKDFADMKIGLDYKPNSMGILMPTRYRNLEKTDFDNAANYIKTVIEVMVKALYDVSQGEYQEFFEDGWFSDSPINKVLKSVSKLGTLISEIGGGVMKMANFKIETEWDPKTGKATKWESLGKKHFDLASENISNIITNLGKSIIKAYDENKKYFDDGEDSKFAEASKAIGTMGQMISSIAQGIQDYANLKFPVYGPDGKIQTYETLDSPKIAAAKQNITELVTVLGSSIIAQVDEHPDWFDDGTDSKFATAMTAVATMGTMLGSIGEGIQAYADLRFPTKFENGVPVEFKDILSTDLTNAGNNIASIISVLGKTIMNIYDGKDYEGNEIIDKAIAHDMFELPGIWDQYVGGKTSNTFVNVVSSVQTLGNMISVIAEAIQYYAAMTVPNYVNGKEAGVRVLTDTDFKQAAVNIATIVCVIGRSLMNLYYGKDYDGNALPGITPDMAKQLFEPAKVTVKAGGLMGLIGMTQEITGDSPFERVLKSVGMMGSFIALIAQSIGAFAAGQIPSGFDANGNPTGYTIMKKADYERASRNIATTLITLGKTIIEASKDPVFSEANTEKLLKISELYVSISSIFTQLNQVSDLINTKLAEQATEVISQQFIESNIANVNGLMSIYEGIYKILSNNTKLSVEEYLENAKNVIDKLKTLTTSETTYIIYLIGQLKTIIEQSSDFDSSKLYTKLLGSDGQNGIIGVYKKVVQELQTINATKEGRERHGLSGLWDSIIGAEEKTTDDIDLFTNSIKKIIDLAKLAADAGSNGYTNISSGITEIDTAVDQIDHNDVFAQHVGVLNAYVETINKIKLNKLTQLTKFTDSMNKLATNMGNLDNLTTAIAEKLTGALTHLSDKLTEAKTTIKDADTLQKKRHEAINESVKNITSLMQQSLRVEIIQVQDDTGDTGERKQTGQNYTPSGQQTNTSNTPPAQTAPELTDISDTPTNASTQQVTTDQGKKANVTTQQPTPIASQKQKTTQVIPSMFRGSDAALGGIAKKVNDIYEWTQRHNT